MLIWLLRQPRSPTRGWDGRLMASPDRPAGRRCTSCERLGRTGSFGRLRQDGRKPSSPTTRNGATVNIVVVGRGNVGGGLARLWTNAGHDVTTLGRDGGDASHADALLVAVPGGAIADALSNVT